MIAVDIFAEAFDIDDRDRERIARGAGAAKSLYRLAKGKAVSGPVLFMDAALSVLDAIGAYARNRQAKAITQQLEIEGEMLGQLLIQAHEQRQILRSVAEAERGQRLTAIRNELKQETYALDINESDFHALAKQIKTLGNLISEQRVQAPPNCTHLLKLEDAYYRLFDLLLATASDRLGQ